jgi:lipopolysaccharide export system protein LptA
MRRALPIVAVLLLAVFPARAEKADRDKPTQIEANRMSADDVKRMTIFEGNVILTKGTIAVRAERIVVRQDAEGFQLTTATGAPVRFKQKQWRSTSASRPSSCSRTPASIAAATKSPAPTSSSTSVRISSR